MFSQTELCEYSHKVLLIFDKVPYWQAPSVQDCTKFAYRNDILRRLQVQNQSEM
jgi:hypothetical protein